MLSQLRAETRKVCLLLFVGERSGRYWKGIRLGRVLSGKWKRPWSFSQQYDLVRESFGGQRGFSLERAGRCILVYIVV